MKGVAFLTVAQQSKNLESTEHEHIKSSALLRDFIKPHYKIEISQANEWRREQGLSPLSCICINWRGHFY